MKEVTLGDILTEKELKRAMKLRKAKDICKEIIEPKLPEINKKLGQENDAMYLAYFVEYAVTQLEKSK